MSWCVLPLEFFPPLHVFFVFGDWIFFLATILQLKVAKRQLFKKVSLERCCVFMDRDNLVKVHKLAKRPISSHLYRTNLVNKGFILWLSGKCFSRDTAGSPERARRLHLAHSISQSHRVICFILPTHGAFHIIILNTSLKQSMWVSMATLTVAAMVTLTAAPCTVRLTESVEILTIPP